MAREGKFSPEGAQNVAPVGKFSHGRPQNVAPEGKFSPEGAQNVAPLGGNFPRVRPKCAHSEQKFPLDVSASSLKQKTNGKS